MAPFQKSRAIGSDYKLKIEVMKSALREGHAAIKFSSLKSSGSSYVLKVGQKRDARRSISAVLKLAECPVCTTEELFLMWVGAVEHNEFKTSFLDFLRITDMKDLCNIMVYREAAAAMVEFMCAVFGEHWRDPWGRVILLLVNDPHLEEVTSKSPSFIVRALGRNLSALFNKLRNPFQVGGVNQDLSDGQWLPAWEADLEETIHVEPFTISTFKLDMEEELRVQLKARVVQNRKGLAKVAAAEDSASDSDGAVQPKKKAKKAAAAAVVAAAPGKGKQVRAAGASASSTTASDSRICFAELAEKCGFSGLDECPYGAGCTFSHDFSALSLKDVKGLIHKSLRSSMKKPGLKEKFTQAVVASGLF